MIDISPHICMCALGPPIIKLAEQKSIATANFCAGYLCLVDIDLEIEGRLGYSQVAPGWPSITLSRLI